MFTSGNISSGYRVFEYGNRYNHDSTAKRMNNSRDTRKTNNLVKCSALCDNSISHDRPAFDINSIAPLICVISKWHSLQSIITYISEAICPGTSNAAHDIAWLQAGTSRSCFLHTALQILRFVRFDCSRTSNSVGIYHCIVMIELRTFLWLDTKLPRPYATSLQCL